MKVIIVLFTLTCAFSLQAKELPQACKDYIKNPKQFKAVPVQQVEGKDIFEFDLEGEVTECSYSYEGGGTCSPENVTCSGGYLNSKSDGAYFGFNQVAVQYKKKLYNFLSKKSRRADLVEVIGEISQKGTTILCDIRQKIVAIKPAPAFHPVCKALTENKVTRIDLINPKVPFDLSRNGSKITYAKDGYESGAGCGCDLDTNKAESKNPLDQAFTKAFGDLNSNEPSCSGESLPLTWSVVQFEKKDYLLTENPGFKVGSLVHANKRLQPDMLYEWDGKSFVRVCSTSYQTEVVAVEPVN